MYGEEVAPTETFVPFSRYARYSKEEALKQLALPCGRFRSPLSTEEKMRLFVSQHLGKTDMLENATQIIAPGTPLNWQVLLRFLHQENLIAAPRFLFPHAYNDLPKMYQVVTEAKSRNDAHGRPVRRDGYALSQSPEEAMSKSVGEFLERYHLGTYLLDSLLRASYTEIQKNRVPAVNIFELNGFLPHQVEKFPRYERNAHKPLRWVKGETIHGKTIYIPAQLIFWNYDFNTDSGEPILVQPTTNGGAGHFTKDEAVLSSLIEHVQRDGFLIYWLNTLTPKQIDATSIQNEEVQKLLQYLRRYGLEIHLLNTTSDMEVPSVTCVLMDKRTDKPIIAIGGGTGFDVRSTILHSIYEALSILIPSKQRETFSIGDSYKPFEREDIGHIERIDAWQGRQMLERFEFFISGPLQPFDEFIGDATKLHSTKDRLQFILKKLEGKGPGHDVYVYEVQSPVLDTLGYHVVKTVVPRMMQIYLNEHMATLDAPRLKSVPKIIGGIAAKTLNPWPHPFP